MRTRVNLESFSMNRTLSMFLLLSLLTGCGEDPFKDWEKDPGETVVRRLDREVLSVRRDVYSDQSPRLESFRKSTYGPR
jgi:hypothetical protein